MDWIRLIKAIGIFLSIIGIVAGVAWIIMIKPTIVLDMILVAASIVSIIVIYTILGER